MSNEDELLPGNPEYERALAQGEFEFAKARFVRTLSGNSVDKLVEIAARERAKLVEEIGNLQTVTRLRYEAALDAARDYGLVLPHRVGRTWLQPPTALEKVGEFHGSDRLYKRAARAAKEYTEAQEVLAKRHAKLGRLENELRARLDKHGEAIERELSIPGGLDLARKRDPLLDRAYNKMKALVGEEAMDRLMTEGKTAPPSGVAMPSQFPDEPL